MSRGYLKTNQYRSVRVRTQDGTSTVLKRVYYIPELGASLLSYRRLCKLELRGEFDTRVIQLFNTARELVLEARQSGGVYLLKKISRILLTSNSIRYIKPDCSYKSDLGPRILETGMITKEEPATQENRSSKAYEKKYTLIHRRFGHIGREVIRNLYTVLGIYMMPNDLYAIAWIYM